MIVKLKYENRLAEAVELRSSAASGQPVAPNGGSVEITFEAQEGVDGVLQISLVCEPTWLPVTKVDRSS